MVGFYRKTGRMIENRVILIFLEWEEFLLLFVRWCAVLGKILQHLDVLDFETYQRNYIPCFTGHILEVAHAQLLSSFSVFESYV